MRTSLSEGHCWHCDGTRECSCISCNVDGNPGACQACSPENQLQLRQFLKYLSWRGIDVRDTLAVRRAAEEFSTMDPMAA